MRAALLAVFLVSCAAPSPRREFHDGPMVRTAPTFVTPGYTPAGAGLPEYVPTGEASTVPRGKDRRVLPPTREPGLWASDGDETRAARSVAVPPMVADIALPFPDGATTVGDRKPTSQCARSLNASISSESWDRMMRLPARVRACLVARLHAYCAVTMHVKYATPAWEKSYQSAARTEENVCKGVSAADTEPIYTTIASEWHTIVRIKEPGK